MGWTRTDAFELMAGKYRLHYRGQGCGGRIVEAGSFDRLMDAQVERDRWAITKGWQVWVEQGGRFVTDDEGEVL